MAPKHKNPKGKERTAVAPYNFIPVADPVITFPDGDPRNPLAVDQGQYHVGRWTGWMDVTLTTKSPIYVRGTLSPTDFEEKERQDASTKDNTPHLAKIRNRAEFFNTGDANEPIIPGSSLRGMIRSVVEILGHGKMKPVMDSPLIYRAVGDTSSHGEAYRKMLMAEDPDRKHHYTPLFEGGFVRKDKDGNWFIQPARKINGVSYGRINLKRIPRGQLNRWHGCRNAHEIYVEVGEYDFKSVRGSFLNVKKANIINAASNSQPGLEKAVLARSGRMFSKKTEAVIFPPDPDADWIPIPDGSDSDDSRDLVTEYKDQISPEQEKLLGKEGALRDYQPVFYVMKNGKMLFFFGHTQMFRMPYPRTPQDFLTPPHKDDNRIDFAEAMFGKVRGSGDGGQAGRVFISDACLTVEQDRNKLWLDGNPEIIPKVLSSPKPTTFQHYLTQSNPNVPKGKGLYTYNNSPSQTTVRGHKMYWHKGKQVKRTDYAENEKKIDQQKDKIHTKIQPVREEVTFTFRIHFENLLPAELGLLWWATTLPVDDNRTYCHKIGMGKPLGLGAVQLTVSEADVHLVDQSRRYETLFANDEQQPWQLGTESQKRTHLFLEEAKSNFETFVLRRCKLPEATLAQTERVKMLLAMLAWPGPNPEETRYMEIERHDPSAKRGKRNEYKERPVLPDPLNLSS